MRLRFYSFRVPFLASAALPAISSYLLARILPGTGGAADRRQCLEVPSKPIGSRTAAGRVSGASLASNSAAGSRMSDLGDCGRPTGYQHEQVAYPNSHAFSLSGTATDADENVGLAASVEGDGPDCTHRRTMMAGERAFLSPVISSVKPTPRRCSLSLLRSNGASQTEVHIGHD